MTEFLKTVFTPVQLIGYVGMLAVLLSYQCKKNRNYFILQSVCAIAFTLHYLFLGSWSAMLLNIVAIARGILFSLGEKCHKRYVLIAIELGFVLASLVSVFVFHDLWWIALCIFIAQAGGTLAMWTRNGKTIRYMQMAIVSPLWLVNNFYFVSIGGILCESFNILSVLISFVRFRKTGFDNT